MTYLVEIAKVEVGERHRQSLGDLGPLVESIEEVGLIHPIVITDSYELVAGQRRLEAVKKLGWVDIPARVLPLSPAEMLRAEHDENVVRRDFTRSEQVAIGRALEAEAARQAKERQEAQDFGRGVTQENFTQVRGATRDIVGQAVGLSGPTYERAKKVVEAAEAHPDQYGDLVEKMDKTGNVAGAVRELEARQNGEPAPESKTERVSSEIRAREIRKLVNQGHRRAQIADKLGIGEQHVANIARDYDIELPDAVIGKTRRLDPNRIVRETVSTLEGLASGVSLLNEELADLDPEQIEGWAISLNDSLKPLNQLRRQLKEMTQ